MKKKKAKELIRKCSEASREEGRKDGVFETNVIHVIVWVVVALLFFFIGLPMIHKANYEQAHTDGVRDCMRAHEREKSLEFFIPQFPQMKPAPPVPEMRI